MERWERERERLDTHTYTKAEGTRNWQTTMCQWQLLEVIFSLLQIKQEHCIHTETMAFAFSIERYSTRLATCLSCDIQFLTSGASLSHSRTVSPDPHDNRNFNVSFSYIVCLLCIHRYPKLPFHYQHQPVLSSAFRSPWKVSHHAHTNCT